MKNIPTINKSTKFMNEKGVKIKKHIFTAKLIHITVFINIRESNPKFRLAFLTDSLPLNFAIIVSIKLFEYFKYIRVL